MKDENRYLDHFSIISTAGTAKSDALEAISKARNGEFDEAHALLKQAEETLNEAHKQMFTMLQDEINGKNIDMNIVAVHGLDHLSMAIVLIDLGKEIINIYQKLGKEENE